MFDKIFHYTKRFLLKKVCSLKVFGTLCNSCIYNHAIFRTLAYLELEASSKDCRACKMIMFIQSSSIVRTDSLFKYFQGYKAYSGILMDIQSLIGM